MSRVVLLEDVVEIAHAVKDGTLTLEEADAAVDALALDHPSDPTDEEIVAALLDPA